MNIPAYAGYRKFVSRANFGKMRVYATAPNTYNLGIALSGNATIYGDLSLLTGES